MWCFCRSSLFEQDFLKCIKRKSALDQRPADKKVTPRGNFRDLYFMKAYVWPQLILDVCHLATIASGQQGRKFKLTAHKAHYKKIKFVAIFQAVGTAEISNSYSVIFYVQLGSF